MLAAIRIASRRACAGRARTMSDELPDATGADVQNWPVPAGRCSARSSTSS